MEKIFNFEVSGRDAIIRQIALIASCIPHELLLDEKKLPLTRIYGDMDGGKSMIAEALIKGMLEDQTPESMLAPDAPRQLYIEKCGNHALTHYCKAVGHVNGQEIGIGFDKISDGRIYKLAQNFKRAVRSENDDKFWHFWAQILNYTHILKLPAPRPNTPKSGMIITTDHYSEQPLKDERNKATKLDASEMYDKYPVFELLNIRLSKASSEADKTTTSIKLRIPLNSTPHARDFAENIERACISAGIPFTHTQPA
jgi:hypothetical protein